MPSRKSASTPNQIELAITTSLLLLLPTTPYYSSHCCICQGMLTTWHTRNIFWQTYVTVQFESFKRCPWLSESQLPSGPRFNQPSSHHLINLQDPNAFSRPKCIKLHNFPIFKLHNFPLRNLKKTQCPSMMLLRSLKPLPVKKNNQGTKMVALSNTTCRAMCWAQPSSWKVVMLVIFMR